MKLISIFVSYSWKSRGISILAKHSLENFSRLAERNLHKKTVDAVLFFNRSKPPRETVRKSAEIGRKISNIKVGKKRLHPLLPIIPFLPRFVPSLLRRSLIRIEFEIKKKRKRKKGIVSITAWYVIQSSRICGTERDWSISGRLTAIYLSFCTPTIKWSVNRLA